MQLPLNVATNWDPNAWGPAISKFLTGKYYRTVAPKNFEVLNTVVPGSKSQTLPVDTTIHGVAKGDTRYKFYPYWHKAVVIGHPAVTATASAGFSNSWDWKYGPVNTPISPITKANLNLPIAPVPQIGM